jgi:hypothetical protein
MSATIDAKVNDDKDENILRVLSFDVGIINLAYCVIEFDFAKNTFKIDKWGILDLADDRHKCPFIIRGGKVCNKIAKRNTKFTRNDQSHYRCPAHEKKGYEDVFKDVKVEWRDIDKDIKCTLCKKYTKATHECDLFEGHYCKTHCKTIARQNKYICSMSKCNEYITKGIHLHDGSVCIGWCSNHVSEYDKHFAKKTRKITQSANHIPLPKVAHAMYTILDKHPEFLLVDEVLVENQEVNSHMKSVAGLLYSYFYMRGIHNVTSKSNIKNIQYYSASLKVTVGGDKSVKKIADAKKKADAHHNDQNKIQYNATKKEGKKLCEALIKGDDAENKRYQEIYYSHKKKDDLADALLQALAKHMKKLPDHYMKKIMYVNPDDDKTTDVKNTKNTKNTKSTKSTKSTKNTKTTNVTKNTKSGGSPVSNIVDNKTKHVEKEVIIEKTINIENKPKISFGKTL